MITAKDLLFYKKLYDLSMDQANACDGGLEKVFVDQAARCEREYWEKYREWRKPREGESYIDRLKRYATDPTYTSERKRQILLKVKHLEAKAKRPKKTRKQESEIDMENTR